MLRNVVTLLIFIVLIQKIFAIYQFRKYDSFIKKLKEKYLGREGYYLLINKAGSIFSNLILIIVINDEDIIKEAYIYKGKFIFSCFNPVVDLFNENISTLDIKEIRPYSKNLETCFRKIKKDYTNI